LKKIVLEGHFRFLTPGTTIKSLRQNVI